MSNADTRVVAKDDGSTCTDIVIVPDIGLENTITWLILITILGGTVKLLSSSASGASKIAKGLGTLGSLAAGVALFGNPAGALAGAAFLAGWTIGEGINELTGNGGGDNEGGDNGGDNGGGDNGGGDNSGGDSGGDSGGGD